MDSIKIKLENYRNIAYNDNIELEISEGTSFVLGVNNVGKSNLLKAFYDLREILNKNYWPSERKNVVIHSNTPFDAMVNRNNLEKEIRVGISYKKITYWVSVFPNEPNKHTTQLLVSYQNHDIPPIGITETDQKDNEHLKTVFQKVLYIGAFRAALEQPGGQYTDITTGYEFIKQWSMWQGSGDVEKAKKLGQLIIELQNLFGYKQFSITPNHDKNNLLITTDDGVFTLNEMGGGITHFIITLGNALIHQPSIILIDEPEAGLHPQMQETFVRALAKKASYGLIATSHSIGLARSVADQISILTRESGSSPVIAPYGQHFHPTISQSLHEMGYSQFAEMGGNKILLVEGRTDVKCFREILRLYGIENKFIILPIGQELIAADTTKMIEELSELTRFNTSVAVIIDSELENSSATLARDRKTLLDECKKLGFATFATDKRATENYITQEAIDKLGLGVNALTQYEERPLSWVNKHKNWLLFNQMKKNDFIGTKLDEFIQNELVEITKK